MAPLGDCYSGVRPIPTDRAGTGMVGDDVSVGLSE